jgi:cell division protein ZapA
MAQVTVRVGGYSHPVACQDGQERHLMDMASEVDKRIGALKAMGMQFGETRMLLLAALQLADETSDLVAENQALKAGGAERLNRVADAIEAIAATLEGA